jgi:hypothetical protein
MCMFCSFQRSSLIHEGGTIVNHKFTDGFFGWTIKIATVIVNAPATYGLAYAAFETIGDGQVLPLALRTIVALSAVVLLEGILLQSWARLDAERSKSLPDPAEEFRHAFKAVAMYFALVAVAFLHGEGLAGVIFRLAFGIQLGISAWDSISREIKQASLLSKTGTRDWIVEGVQRRLMRQTQIFELRQFWGKDGVERYRRSQDAVLERSRIEVDTAVEKQQLVIPTTPQSNPVSNVIVEKETNTKAAVVANDDHPTVSIPASPLPVRPINRKKS